MAIFELPSRKNNNQAHEYKSLHPFIHCKAHFLKLELRPLRIAKAIVTRMRSGGTDMPG